MTSLGGQITAESRPGEGRDLPRRRCPRPSAVEAAPAPVPAREVPAAAAAPRLALLVVDDESAIGRTLAIALGDEFDVATATSGREALAVLGGERRFDVVLCDLMMPDVSGMDVHERVTQLRPDLAQRFVFVTGGAFTERARRFVEQVALPVVEKPFDLKKLPALLRERAATGSSTGSR